MKEYINIGWNIETFVHLSAITIGLIFLIFFLRIDCKRYGLLFLLVMIVGNLLCYIFVSLDFYSYPFRLFPHLSTMPITTVTLSFPVYVLIGVRYSPRNWPWKIPFYWTLIHIGVALELIGKNEMQLIRYGFEWDTWDSYTWWWIFFLAFEWIGGKIIPDDLRKPIDVQHLRYGKIGWIIIHFILIVTIFLAGYYLGSMQ